MNRIKLTIIGAALMLAAVISQAQTTTPFQFGVPFQVGNQTFLITTNGTGQTLVTTVGPFGTNSVVVPMTPQEAANTALNLVAQNNPANASYYNTNGEWEARIGAAYLQNSGQAVAALSVAYWGIYSTLPNVGLEAGVLQGNNAGQSGTAGAYGGVEYRKVIGDVAGIGGVGGGYDNWNHRPFGYVKAGVEYRQNPHLGEFVDVIYAFESVNSNRGLLAAAGIIYAF